MHGLHLSGHVILEFFEQGFSLFFEQDHDDDEDGAPMRLRSRRTTERWM